jgi:hypothetical protein
MVRGWEWDRVGLLSSVAVGVVVGLAMAAGRFPLPGDAQLYWQAGPGSYSAAAYVYPPVLSQALVPLRWMPWPAFAVLWEALLFASAGWALGRWAPLVILAGVAGSLLPWPLGEALAGPLAGMLMGNVTMLMVAAMVAGMRRPGWWAVPLLTKMTPAVGLLWFAFRGEWRRLALGLGVTAIVAGVSAALAPGAWASFTSFALAHSGDASNGPPIVGPPLWLRLPGAVLIVAWGARTGRPWAVPLAGAMALAGLYGWGAAAGVAVGALGLVDGESRERL